MTARYLQIADHTATRVDAAPIAGLNSGTRVFTLEGPVVVEALQPGDRIVTRSGALALRALSCVAPSMYRMEFDAPEVVYLEDSQIRSDTCTPYLH